MAKAKGRDLSDKRYYVYQLINPINDSVFYVGKGTGKRMFAHERNYKNGNELNTAKAIIIKSIIDAGFSVKADIIHGDLTEPEAFKLEHDLIIEIGYTKLTNIHKGNEPQEYKDIIKAKFSLSKMIPFDKWISLAKRSDLHIELYHKCKIHFEYVASGEYARQLNILNGQTYKI